MSIAIPFTSLALVPHAAGGAILRGAEGYIASTYVPAGVVNAFATAGSALHAMGSSTVAIASANPILTGTLVVAVVVAGTYCFLNGVPAPVAETLIHAGLASPTEKGLAVLIPKLATALVLLGAAGYVAYRFYVNFAELWADRDVAETWRMDSESAAREELIRSFGAELWSTVGEAVWATKADVAHTLVAIAERALGYASDAASAVSSGAYAAYDVAWSGSGEALKRTRSILSAIWGWASNVRFRRT